MGRIFFRRRGPVMRRAGLLAAAVLALGASAWTGMAVLDWWVDFSDEPAAADALVVLAGSYSRPPFAADLYLRGLAREVWLSRPAPYPADEKVRELGVPLPREEEINRQILLKMGVPASAIRFYGADVLSTADEARSFAREFASAGKRVLVVTSRYHARRSKIIFKARLPASEVLVVGSPYDDPVRNWRRNKFLASLVVLEGFKTAFYFAGGRFMGNAPIR